jgi:hypothetical protein
LAPLTSVEVTTIVSPIVIESPDANFPLNKKEKKKHQEQKTLDPF